VCSEWQELPGNHLVVRMRGGESAVFAHFVPGSVAVRVGQRVRRGDLLGRLGNSGASLAPHLHFHVVDGDSAATSDGTPFVLDRFGISGSAGVSQLLAALRGEPAFPRPGSTRSVEHRDELPLGFTIDDFPG
jgi:murein DD-endopeptidase MepM/ murein hydrolase activator NlpD